MKESKKEKFIFYSLIPLCIILVLVVWFLGNLGNEIFINFIASFGGAVFGGVVTLMGLYVTISQQTNQYEEQKQLSVIPYLELNGIYASDYSRGNYSDKIELNYNNTATGSEREILLSVENLGIASALKVKIDFFDLDNKVVDNDLNQELTIKNGEKKAFDIIVTNIDNISDGNKLKVRISYINILQNKEYTRDGYIELSDHFDRVVINEAQESNYRFSTTILPT